MDSMLRWNEILGAHSNSLNSFVGAKRRIEFSRAFQGREELSQETPVASPTLETV